MKPARVALAGLAGFLGLAMGGCEKLVVACAAPGQHAFAVTITDSVTGLGAWKDASLIVANAQRYDSGLVNTHVFDPIPDTTQAVEFSSSTDVRGIFDVRVRKAGYDVWERSAIGVSGDGCRVNTVRLSARLRRTVSAE